MTYPVAMIPYANMAPYRELGAPRNCRFVACLPSASVTALLQNRVIAAAVPVGGLAALGGQVEPLGPYGIVAREKSMSVLFFSQHPMDQMRAPARIWLTGDSESSVRLLFLLLGYAHGFDRLPLTVANPEHAQGELVIGDAALKRILLECRPQPAIRSTRCRADLKFVTDLASGWYAVHRLPFVFARWVVRKDAPSDAKNSLKRWLNEFGRREDMLVARCIPKTAAALGVSRTIVSDYFTVIRRRLEDVDQAGQERFLSELATHLRNPLFQPAREST